MSDVGMSGSFFISPLRMSNHRGGESMNREESTQTVDMIAPYEY